MTYMVNMWNRIPVSELKRLIRRRTNLYQKAGNHHQLRREL
jgi:hypothetical protein